MECDNIRPFNGHSSTYWTFLNRRSTPKLYWAVGDVKYNKTHIIEVVRFRSFWFYSWTWFDHRFWEDKILYCMPCIVKVLNFHPRKRPGIRIVNGSWLDRDEWTLSAVNAHLVRFSVLHLHWVFTREYVKLRTSTSKS